MKNKELKEFIYNNVYQNASTGYVLTPSELAYEMISTLPEDVFISETTTFLDPICKCGTFLFEIVEKLYEQGHTISNIQNRIYTIDSNSHSYNVAGSNIKKILNKESGAFRFDYKHEFVEKFYNRLITSISGKKHTSLQEFLDIILLDKKDHNLMELLKDNISDFIKQYEKVSKLESKLFGEVFTPRQLIDEMLDTLPSEVWKNKDLKWLDPSVGIGNFPAAILDRLMVGLQEEIVDDEERKRWILEEMLYMVDISTKNLFLLYMLFDRNQEYKLNVYRGSFLEEEFDKHMKDVWALDSFDVVVGNPPYQVSNATGDNKLYLEFSKKSIQALKNKGTLLFITPKNILDYLLICDKNRNYFDQFYKIESLVIDIPAKYFSGVGSTFLYFNLKKDTYDGTTKIRCYDHNRQEVEFDIALTKGQSIPNNLSGLDLSIISKIRKRKEKFNFKKMKMGGREFRIRKKQLVDGKVFLSQNEEYMYPVIDGLNKSNPFPGKVFYMKNNFADGVPKLIINGSGYLCPSFDSTGEYFLSDNIIYLHVANEYEFNNLKFIFESKLTRYWLNQFRLNGFSDAKNIQDFPFIRYDIQLSSEYIYEQFNLTPEEIELIEKTVTD